MNLKLQDHPAVDIPANEAYSFFRRAERENGENEWIKDDGRQEIRGKREGEWLINREKEWIYDQDKTEQMTKIEDERVNEWKKICLTYKHWVHDWLL